MKKNTELLKKIAESLSQISEEKYNHIKEWKYIYFAMDGKYGGYSHFKLNLRGTPLEVMEPITYMPPMMSKDAMISGIQELIDQPENASNLTNRKRFFSPEEMENHLFGLHSDGYNRLSRFFEVEDRIQPELYCSTLRRVYNDSIKKYRYREELKRAFKKTPQEGLMTKEEEDIFNNLDERVTIYRAMSAKENELEDYGVSWTLYEDIALEIGQYCFGNLWEQAGFLVKRLEVSKADLHALFNQRKMWEVIYAKKKEEIPPQHMEINFLMKP